MVRTVGLRLHFTPEERGDRWAILYLPMGIIAYGLTEEEVRESFLGAVRAVVDSFEGDEVALAAWLDLEGVGYQWHSSDTESASDSCDGARLYELVAAQVATEQSGSEYMVTVGVGATR